MDEEIDLKSVMCIEKDEAGYYAYLKGDINTGVGITKNNFLKLKNLKIPTLAEYYNGKRRPK